MGNTYGVIRDGLTAKEVAPAMQAFVDERFPGVFVVEYGEDAEPNVALKFKDEPDRWLMVWFEWEHEPGLVGGNSMEPAGINFSWWVMFAIMTGTAIKLGANVYVDALDPMSRPPEQRMADNKWFEYIGMMRFPPDVSHVRMEREMVEELAPVLLPWFDGR